MHAPGRVCSLGGFDCFGLFSGPHVLIGKLVNLRVAKVCLASGTPRFSPAFINEGRAVLPDAIEPMSQTRSASL